MRGARFKVRSPRSKVARTCAGGQACALSLTWRAAPRRRGQLLFDVNNERGREDPDGSQRILGLAADQTRTSVRKYECTLCRRAGKLACLQASMLARPLVSLPAVQWPFRIPPSAFRIAVVPSYPRTLVRSWPLSFRISHSEFRISIRTLFGSYPCNVTIWSRGIPSRINPCTLDCVSS